MQNPIVVYYALYFQFQTSLLPSSGQSWNGNSPVCETGGNVIFNVTLVGGSAYSSGSNAGARCEHIGCARLRDHLATGEVDTGAPRPHSHQLDHGPRSRRHGRRATIGLPRCQDLPRGAKNATRNAHPDDEVDVERAQVKVTRKEGSFP